MDGWIERERERFSDVSRPMPYALDRASRLHREEACLSLACVHRRAELEREREREGDWSVCFLVGGGGGFDWVLILLFDNLGEVWEGREFYCFTGSSIRVLERERERVE